MHRGLSRGINRDVIHVIRRTSISQIEVTHILEAVT
jgi:hypothetical protein